MQVVRLCGLAVKTSIWWHMDLFNMCVQKEWKAAFVFKVSGRLFFSLFIISWYCTKSICSRQGGGCFLVYSPLINISCLKKEGFKVSGSLLFSLFIINQYCMPKRFYHQFYKNSVKGCFLNCYFLVYLANCTKLLWTAAF